MDSAVLAALITAGLGLLGSFCGSYCSNRKNAALLAYRMEQLERRVQAHNNLIERTYKLEERTELQEEKLKVANHRIGDLEEEIKNCITA